MVTIKQDRDGIDVAEVALVVDLDRVQSLAGQESLVEVADPAIVPGARRGLPGPLCVAHIIRLWTIGEELFDRHSSHGEIPLGPGVD